VSAIIYGLEVLSLLTTLPGVMLIHILTERKLKVPFSLSELILVGSVIWNFILIVPSLLAGFFGPYILNYFLVFIFISIGVILAWLSLIILRRLKLSFLFSPLPYFNLFPLFLLFFFTLMITVYHPLFLEWDAVSVYLPSAKSIAMTGGLYSIYHVSEVITFLSPALSIIYAWIFFLARGDYFRLLPFIYFLLTCLTLYQLSRRVSGTHGALIAVFIFASMVSTIRILAIKSLYLDIAFNFFTSVSIFFVRRATEDHNSFWYLFTGMASALAVLTKQLGFITLLLVFSLIILSLDIKFRRTVFLICVLAVFNFFFLWDALAFLHFPEYLKYVFIRQLPIIVLTPVLFFLSNRYKKGSATLKDIGMFSLPMAFIVLVVIRNIRELGIVSGGWGPGISEASNLSSLIFPLRRSVDIGSFFAWHPLFLSIGLGAIYLIPMIIGTCDIIYKSCKGDHVPSILLIWVIAFIMMWAFFFGCTYQDFDFRNLYHFAPVFSIIIAKGVNVFTTFLRINEKYSFYPFILFNTIVLVYVWTYYFNGSMMDNLFAFKFNIPDILNIYFFSLLFIIIFLLYRLFVRKRISFCVAIGSLHKKISFLASMSLLTIILSQIVLFNSIILPVVSYVNRNGWDPRNYNNKYPTSGFANIFEVIDYYNTQVKNNYITISFYAYFLMYYSNRSVIDLGYLYGYQSILPILNCNDSSTLLHKLFNSNIRYFLIPKPSHPTQSIYEAYERCFEHFLLFREIKNNRFFIVANEFTYYTLHKLLSPQEYSEYIKAQ